MPIAMHLFGKQFTLARFRVVTMTNFTPGMVGLFLLLLIQQLTVQLVFRVQHVFNLTTTTLQS